MQRLLKEGIDCAATYVRVVARSPGRGARLKTSLRFGEIDGRGVLTISRTSRYLVVFTEQKTKSTLILNYQVDFLLIFSGSEQSRTAVQIGY